MRRCPAVHSLLPRRFSALGWALLLAAFAPSQSAADETPPELARLRQLFEQRQFFALRDALADVADLATAPVEIRFYRAALQQAFNQPAASNATIETLLAERPSDAGLVIRLRALQLTNFQRLHRYRAGLEAAQAMLSAPGLDLTSPMALEAQSKVPLFRALVDVPPQEVEIRGPSRLALGKTRRVPLEINGEKFAFALDTGANLSVIMRSEAEKLGLEIREARLVISTSTARQVTGDLAVARRVEIGHIHYSHVVFLVLPDELLTFAKGRRIPGLVGFPLVDAAGEMRFRRDNVLEIPRQSRDRSLQNLALDDLDPLVTVRYGKEDLLCRLDTGAPDTVFYEPFFRRYRERLESIGRPLMAKATGVGGMQEIPAIRLPTMALTVAAAGVNLRRVEVYKRSIRPPQENILDCNLGLDALRGFRAYTLDFRNMALVLE